jgi:peroxiredoxin
MRKIFYALMIVSSITVFASANVGEKAPDFSLQGSDGKTYELSKVMKNKDTVVVLEWFNEGCPYVRKHYGAGNMQRLQGEELAKGHIAWFTISSSAKGKQGYLSSVEDAKKIATEKGMKNTALLLDPGSKIAAAYGAKTTPHMFVINKKGLIAYNGAIDSQDTARPIKLEEYKNDKSIKKYVEDAVTAVAADGTPKVATTDPYGCSVKY